jgi:hypothetical protein
MADCRAALKYLLGFTRRIQCQAEFSFADIQQRPVMGKATVDEFRWCKSSNWRDPSAVPVLKRIA